MMTMLTKTTRPSLFDINERTGQITTKVALDSNAEVARATPTITRSRTR